MNGCTHTQVLETVELLGMTGAMAVGVYESRCVRCGRLTSTSVIRENLASKTPGNTG